MPKIQTITLQDGKTTPVSHSFTPQRINANEVAEFRERVAGSLIGQPTLSIQLREQKSGLNAVDLRLVIPSVVITNDVNGVPQSVVSHQESGFVSFKLPQRGTKQARRDVRIMLANALLNADVAAVIDDGEALIGG